MRCDAVGSCRLRYTGRPRRFHDPVAQVREASSGEPRLAAGKSALGVVGTKGALPSQKKLPSPAAAAVDVESPPQGGPAQHAADSTGPSMLAHAAQTLAVVAGSEMSPPPQPDYSELYRALSSPSTSSPRVEMGASLQI